MRKSGDRVYKRAYSAVVAFLEAPFELKPVAFGEWRAAVRAIERLESAPVGEPIDWVAERRAAEQIIVGAAIEIAHAHWNGQTIGIDALVKAVDALEDLPE